MSGRGRDARPAALVTGGAKRIGRRIAERLAGAGYAVAIHCHRSRGEAERLARALAEDGAEAVVVTGDLAGTDLDGLVAEAGQALGPLTLLVNNASVFEPDDARTLTPESFDRHVGVNLRAPLLLTRAFAAQVPPGRDGAVVNILDQRVLKPTPGFFSYALAKSALFHATRSLAQALAPGVRVNAVGPGPTLPSARQSEADFARQSAAVLLGRGPSPDDVADAVLYLASARSVTGQMIAVDGGQHLAWDTADARVAE